MKKLLSIAAAITVAANLITPVLAVDTASGNTVTESASGNVNMDVVLLAQSGEYTLVGTPYEYSSKLPTILISDTDGSEQFVSINSAIDSGKFFTVEYLTSETYADLCTALKATTLRNAQVAEVANIEANDLAKTQAKQQGGAVLTLKVAGIVATDRVAVVHFHGDEKEVLPATAGDGTVKFTLPEDFSPFVVVKLSEGVDVQGSSSSTLHRASNTSSTPSATSSTTASSTSTTTSSGYAVPNTAVK